MDPFIGQITMFGGNFAPRGWALCDGQLLSISSNQALFSILGTTFGGDGRTTFGLPDLRGRVAMHPGTGSGLTTRSLGERGGAETVTLNTNQIPSHSHEVQCKAEGGGEHTPVNNFCSLSPDGDYSTTADNIMDVAMIKNTGGTQAHNNVQPYHCVNYIIALVGTFPSRN